LESDESQLLIVHASNAISRWASGIFTTVHAGRSDLASIPEDLRSSQVLMPFPPDHTGFRFLDEASTLPVLAELAALDRQDSDECFYANRYRISGEWQPRMPGTDYIMNDTLDWVNHAFSALLP
jgi:hypothetical protein